MLTPNQLTCEYCVNPLGLGTRQPRLSWKLSADADARDVRQSAYHIVVAADPDGADAIWDTGKVPSGQSVHVRYAGPDLRSGRRCYWRVRV